MRDKTPKHEIVIKSSPFDFYVWIAVTSEDAANWIEVEAPRFGELIKRETGKWQYAFFTDKKANPTPTEVCEYLAGHGLFIPHNDDEAQS